MAGGNTKSVRATAELRKRIVELRDQDLEFREIAAIVGRDVAVVWRQYQRAMREIPATAVEEHARKAAQRLDEQLLRIDMEREVLMDIVAKRHVHISNGRVIHEIVGTNEETGKPLYGEPYEDDAPTMQAIDRLGRLDDQEAKLLGIYPKQTISVERPTSELDAARIALIEQAKARVAERRAAAKAAAP
jgi:hypothetical protein